eukprot:2369315-Pyramimonas_sp.AAC.1
MGVEALEMIDLSDSRQHPTTSTTIRRAPWTSPARRAPLPRGPASSGPTARTATAATRPLRGSP